MKDPFDILDKEEYNEEEKQERKDEEDRQKERLVGQMGSLVE